MIYYDIFIFHSFELCLRQFGFNRSTIFEWSPAWTTIHYSDIVSDIPLSGSRHIYPDILSDNSRHSFWYILWHSIWQSIWHLFSIDTDIVSDILSSIFSGIHSGKSSDILSTFFLSYVSSISCDILSCILSGISLEILGGWGPAGTTLIPGGKHRKQHAKNRFPDASRVGTAKQHFLVFGREWGMLYI